MFGMGYGEWIIVLAIALLVFGPKKLPDLGRAVGRSIKEFREGMKELNTSIETAVEEKKIEPEVKPAAPVAAAQPSSGEEPKKTS